MSLPTILQHVADQGFEGVEFANRIHDADLQAVARTLDETGLEPIAAHVPLDRLTGNFESVLETCATIGCSRVVIPYIPASQFLSTTRIDALAVQFGELSDRLTARGIELAIHTTKSMHKPIVGKYSLERMVDSHRFPSRVWLYVTNGMTHVLPEGLKVETGFERLLRATEDTDITFEIDVEHAAGLNQDAYQLFELVGDRLFAVHLSDGRRLRTFPSKYESCPLGDGYVDIDRMVAGAFRYNAD